jgi:hypothetical protein
MKKIVINIFILYRKNSIRGAPLFKTLIPIISKKVNNSLFICTARLSYTTTSTFNSTAASSFCFSLIITTTFATTFTFTISSTAFWVCCCYFFRWSLKRFLACSLNFWPIVFVCFLMSEENGQVGKDVL